MPDWPSIALTAAATAALFRYKVGVISLIFACGILGLAWKLLL